MFAGTGTNKNETLGKIETPQENETPVTCSTRSRKRRPETWRRFKRALEVVQGLEHQTKAGTLVSAKRVKLQDCKCKFRCTNFITAAQQEILFKEYRTMSNRDDQRAFLRSLMQTNPVQRRRTNSPTICRNISITYSLKNDDGQQIRVCQKFFCNTFGISAKVVANISHNVSPKTGRFSGRHKNAHRPPHNRTEECRIRKVISFIRKIPKVPSHYCRKGSNFLYFEPELNMTKLYDEYQKTNDEPVSMCIFVKTLKDHDPPVAFHKPKKDQCPLCNAAKGKEAEFPGYLAHIARKNAIRTMKAADKNDAIANPKLVMATFDLQAILVLPYASDSTLYYSRKLAVYNFTIYDSYKNGTCNVWSEVDGKKGSTEVGTCILNYLHSLPTSVEHVIFYCDTCGGQNRNQFIVSALLYAVNRTENLRTIDLKYLESGHSVMECDSMHSTIERARKNLKIYTPEEYAVLMGAARKNPRPYVVNQLKFSDFYNLHDLTQRIMKNRKLDENKKPVQWLLIKWFRFQKGVENKVWFKYNVEDADFHCLIINQKWIRSKCTTVPITYRTLEKTAYSECLPISVAKKRDLLALLQEGVIPTVYANFYKSLPAHKNVKDVATWVDRKENEEVEEEEIFLGINDL